MWISTSHSCLDEEAIKMEILMEIEFKKIKFKNIKIN